MDARYVGIDVAKAELVVALRPSSGGAPAAEIAKLVWLAP